ncbi:anti-repressor SinI family protein [Aneurinibacillus sp. BA2021]|nr:anti-repressor SinI family protein [Aneurinibacillus sp. BA2021]
MVRKENELDQEWVSLMLTARKIGITPEEIREFLKSENKIVIQAALEPEDMAYNSYGIG